MSKLPNIFLASQSPRRRELLARIGIRFQIVPRIPFKENEIVANNPDEYAENVARRKAENAIVPEAESGIVLAFDTIVFVDGVILGKPKDEREARYFLKKLSGRWHTVFTGVAVMTIPERRLVSSVEATDVLFSELYDDEISVYIASGEPMDKAGAYGIQELGALFIKRVNGCFYNVVGLPLLCLTNVLKEINIKRISLISSSER